MEKSASAKTSYLGPDGQALDAKPESMTSLIGRQLAEKDHPTIVLRGKIDSFCALALDAQALGELHGNNAFIEDIQGALDFARSLYAAEYQRVPLGEFRILGMTSDELREKSHYPQKHFGHGHLLMDRSMGPLCLRINLLRAAAREAEIAASTALQTIRADGSGLESERCYEDIVMALNRLSSLFYILVYKYLPDGYVPAGSPWKTTVA
ncbi:MAG: hypothetical protein FWE09_01685 [Treponema sp.]|nr:hypothetical protein [Treponema sp.]